MRSTYITATVIALLIVLWLGSGMLGQEATVQPTSLAESNRAQARIDQESAPTRVRVAVLQASERDRLVKVRGRTQNKRTVVVKAELSGRVVERPIERGSVVAEGETLCRLSVEDRSASLREAREALQQARIEFKGAVSLQQRGFNSETAIAGAKARLAAAQANVDRRQLDMAKIVVRAPFDGIVEDIHQEVGDFVTPGAQCATVVDMDPMLLVGRVSEQTVIGLQLGQSASGVMSNGKTVSGPVTFIGQTSDPATRTYPIEIQLDNAELTIRSGITTAIEIPVDSVMAQKVSPALFALDDEGAIGIRTINGDNTVEFHNVEIVADAPDGVWVTGLPNRAAIITVGQELVSPGERVDPVYMGTTTMPASTDAEAEVEVEVEHSDQLNSSDGTPTLLSAGPAIGN